MGGSDSPEIWHVGNGTHGEPFVNETVVDEHVGHTKHRNAKALIPESRAIN